MENPLHTYITAFLEQVPMIIVQEQNFLQMYLTNVALTDGIKNIQKVMDLENTQTLIILHKVQILSQQLFEKSIDNFEEQLLKQQFNIQRIASYEIIKKYFSDLSKILEMQYKKNLEYEVKDEYYYFISFDALLQPIDKLIQNKMGKQNSLIFIFVINVYTIQAQFLNEIKNIQILNEDIIERLEKISKEIDNLKNNLVQNNYTDLIKIGKLEFVDNVLKQIQNKLIEQQSNQKNNTNDSNNEHQITNEIEEILKNEKPYFLQIKNQNEKFEKAKLIFQFLLNLTNEFAKKLIIRDLYLIHNNEVRQYIKEQLIEKFYNLYQYIFNEIIIFGGQIIQKTQQQQLQKVQTSSNEQDLQNESIFKTYENFSKEQQINFLKNIALQLKVKVSDYVENDRDIYLLKPSQFKDDLYQISKFL
ncbi:hypothetical protein PPERSA_11376 [Pseudocohnilembus persalinus]|uniref:Uncharacterized protein n=1 Tax=Pseudocohnilembus persalinus TaxID=266149 RepID=A0A0V0QQ13_PSEPJ|nr:hypothetical protein PPERSA_11376 [Pseudocohnilembus persalinus]|eukprot:KRX04252.1 hypothetical protein PPERSA_11376 [Pseudocohnilembus persalinus]